MAENLAPVIGVMSVRRMQEAVCRILDQTTEAWVAAGCDESQLDSLLSQAAAEIETGALFMAAMSMDMPTATSRSAERVYFDLIDELSRRAALRRGPPPTSC